ncbi:MAG: biopolymer transporter ExbD [Ginsengibacter sp.]
MGRAKIKRGSTNIDMTAMCDVAFLLLSFFILTTKFKPAEAVDVSPPSSVSAKAAPQNDAFTVSLDKTGRVFIDMSDEMKGDVFDEVNTARSLGFTADDRKFFRAATFVGVPFSQLKQFIRLQPEDLKNTKLSGVPTDSTNNELQAWINAAVNVYKSRKINFLIKGDNDAKYESFKGVINAFKKNEIFKYQLITNPEGVPVGTALYENNMHPQAGSVEEAK